MSGVLQAHAIYSSLVLYSLDRKTFTESLVDVCKDWEKSLSEKFTWYKMGNLLTRLQWIDNNRDVSSEEAFSHLGSSSAIYQSYPFALWMFQKYWNDPIEGLIETVNYGGDCDTTGAIYGSLCGARNGIIFPTEWSEGAKGMDEAMELGKKLFSLRRKFP